MLLETLRDIKQKQRQKRLRSANLKTGARNSFQGEDCIFQGKLKTAQIGGRMRIYYVFIKSWQRSRESPVGPADRLDPAPAFRWLWDYRIGPPMGVKESKKIGLGTFPREGRLGSFPRATGWALLRWRDGLGGFPASEYSRLAGEPIHKSGFRFWLRYFQFIGSRKMN